MSRNNIISNKGIKNNYKTYFFENIFYWLSYYFIKFIPKKYHTEYQEDISYLLSALKGFNILAFISLISVILNKNILKWLFSGEKGLVMVFFFLLMLLLIQYYDKNRYLKRLPIIRQKYNDKSAEQNKKTKEFLLLI